jgi:hypothetical protein
MRYSLIRLEDGAGDSGIMCEILDFESRKSVVGATRPKIGYGVRVGSPYGRTYSSQDWWQCSPVTEILEEREDYMKFKTRSSTYEWKTF